MAECNDYPADYGSTNTHADRLEESFELCGSTPTKINHKEAAVYVKEGKSNDEFVVHPEGKWSKRAFQTLHKTAYRVYHLCVCTLILLLTLIEHPSLVTHADLYQSSLTTIVVVNALFELTLLALIWIDIILKILWFCPKCKWSRNKYFFTHRIAVLFFVLIVMSIEAVVVIVRQENHFRVTRALRPIFLLDTYYMGDVRRVLRQILECFRPILEVLILMMLILVIFSLLGFLFFAETDVTYFATFSRSLVSFFITLTTANHPDVLMEAYIRQPLSPIFFVIYIILTVYFINSVLLAIVYHNFRDGAKKKFKKLFLHKRTALHSAFNNLKTHTADTGEGIEFHNFLLFMHHYRPRVPAWQVMCIFKALHENREEPHRKLSLQEFYDFYEVQDYKWEVAKDGQEFNDMWFEHKQYSNVTKKSAKILYHLVKSRWFNMAFNIVMTVNLITLVVYTLFITEEEVERRYLILNKKVAMSLFFVSIYLVEIWIRAFAKGPCYYFCKPRNLLDGLVIHISFVLLIVEASSPSYAFLAAARPFKFFRLLKLKRSYRDIMRTLLVLGYRLLSVSILLVLIYYFFAVIGMEFFSDKVYENCCNASWYNIGTFYSGNNQTYTPNVYYLLDFDAIFHSYLTLFVLMVANNWYIIMEGFASTTDNSWLARLYFMAFFMSTLVVLQIIVSFIVDSFEVGMKMIGKERHESRDQQKHCECPKFDEKCVKSRKYKKTIHGTLLPHDIQTLKAEIRKEEIATPTCMYSKLNRFIRKKKKISLLSGKDYKFYGRRRRTKDDIYSEMYEDEMEKWKNEKKVLVYTRCNKSKLIDEFVEFFV